MESGTNLSRRRVMMTGAGVALATVFGTFAGSAHATEGAVRTRLFRHSNEYLPVAGIGTVIMFNYGNKPGSYFEPGQVNQSLIMGGGSLINEAHSYAHARERLARFAADMGVGDTLFLAATLSGNNGGAAETAPSQVSSRRIATDHVDFVQAANAGDANDGLGLSSVWEKQALCRYVGMTTSSDRQYSAIEKALACDGTYFPRVNNSFGGRETESFLLPTAQNAGTVVHVDFPLERNSFSILEYAALGAIQLTLALNRERGQENGGWSLIATSFL